MDGVLSGSEKRDRFSIQGGDHLRLPATLRCVGKMCGREAVKMLHVQR